MRFFFRSKPFKVAVVVVSVVLVLSVAAGLIGGFIAPQANLLGTVAAPFQHAATAVSSFFRDFADRLQGADAVLLENASLQSEVDRLTSDLLGYQQAVTENEFLREYLEIKEQNPDFQFEPAMRIARDAEDPFGGFSINKGSQNGISPHDPVITSSGLVGYISEVGLTYSKVTTVLSAELQAGGFDRRTRDAGVVSGSLALAEKKQTRLYNLARTCSVAVGDYIVTSGGGFFPEGLLVGQVESIEQEAYNSALYAVVTPAADLENLRDVMVLTYFTGQNSTAPTGE